VPLQSLCVWEGDGHSAPRAPPVSGARLVQVKRAAGLACVGPGDRRHSMVGGQVESESLCLSVWRSFLALCLSVSVGVCRCLSVRWSNVVVRVNVVSGDLVCLVVMRSRRWTRPSRSAISSVVPLAWLSAVSPRSGVLAW
jgi:hypothetical protein